MSMALYRRPWPSILRDVFGEDPFGGGTFESPRCWAPPVDVFEKEGVLNLEFELPGLLKKDIGVEFNEGILTVSGDRRFREEGEGIKFYSAERATGKFSRAFRIGEGFDPKTISASFKDGILYVTISKKEESKPLSVKIS